MYIKKYGQKLLLKFWIRRCVTRGFGYHVFAYSALWLRLAGYGLHKKNTADMIKTIKQQKMNMYMYMLLDQLIIKCILRHFIDRVY